MKFLLNLIGILVILALAFLLSKDRKSVAWKTILKALCAQFIIAFFLLKVPFGKMAVSAVSNAVSAVIGCGQAGLDFVFGSLADSTVSGSIFIVQVLGNIIFLSAMVSLLYYVGVLGFVVKWIGKAVGKIMGTTETESFVAVANMFLGQTDSPILISKNLNQMTDSEIMVVLVSGMGSMSVSTLGGYAALGIPMDHLLIASTLVPIGSIMLAKILLPQTEQTVAISEVKMDNKGNNANVIEAIAEGAMTGMQMVLSIAASLVAMVGLVFAINQFIGVFGLSLEEIFSYVFAPFGYFMGLEGSEIFMEGSFLGSKIVLNEFIAFQELGEVIGTLSERSSLICAVSLCGFANFSSLGICVSGIAVLCPEKKSTLARLVFRAMLGGVLVSLLSAMLVGFVTLF